METESLDETLSKHVPNQRISENRKIVFGMVAMPWTPVAAQPPAADTADQKDKMGYGKFVSFNTATSFT